MTNLEPLWRRMAVRLANISLLHPNVLDRERKMAAALNDEMAGVLGAARAVPIAFGKYHYGDTGQYAVLLEATNLLRTELERLLKGTG